ncbi:MAG TPA: peptide chain release factor N(5)-glutamine methyltransferase [Gemmataceae bacterium]|nr:peptide chain release factor N(5)-glutamine methyltransferase [Gemmataceae bacterium]
MEPKIDNRPPKRDEPWTIGRLLDWTAKFLAQKGSEFPRLDAEVLLSHALGCKRIELYTRYEELAAEEARARFKELIRKRLEGCPVAYLVGRKEFFSLEFEVGPTVLIPRPDTETLVVEALRLAKEMTEPAVLDLGTGSGAIPIAIAKRHKTARLTATDVSLEALAVAQRNAAKHGVAERIHFLHGDLFEPISSEERFDFILSNPPYIAREDIAALPVGVRDYEPHLALDGGIGGYAVFDRLIHEAPRYLKPGGYLIVEIGAPQEGPARQRIAAYAGYDLGPTIKDGSGHPRVLRARWHG